MTKPSSPEIDPRLVRLERMDAIEQLVKRIGHDFNNLFGIVIGATGVLKEEISERPGLDDLKVIVNDAESAGKEGAELLARLLACFGHQVLHAKLIQPNPLIQNIIERYMGALGENVALQCELVSDPPPVEVDAEKLESAVQSLLDNALEAMPAGGVLRISSEVRRREDVGASPVNGNAATFLGISVSDSGEGIESALLKRVTEPFFTTRQPAKDRGLGLSLVYGFALQSGGGLCIDRINGGGARATLWLPAATEASARTI